MIIYFVEYRVSIHIYLWLRWECAREGVVYTLQSTDTNIELHPNRRKLYQYVDGPQGSREII